MLCAAQPNPPPLRRLANKHLVHGNDAGPDGYALDYNSFARRLFPQTAALRRRQRQQPGPEQQRSYLGRHAARRKQPHHSAGPTKQR